MKNSSSHSTACSHPNLCYDSLIKQCMTCVNRSSHGSPTTTTCAHTSLCYDRLIKQCVSCRTMERGAGRATRTEGTCAPPHLCYDRLIKQCVRCAKLHRGTEETNENPRLKESRLAKRKFATRPPKKTSVRAHCCSSLDGSTTSCSLQSAAILGVVPTTNQELHVPATRTTGQGGSAFVFGVYALVGLVLAIAAVLWLVTQKHKRRQRLRQAANEDCEENENCIFSSEHQVHKSPNLLGKEDHVLLTCPYSNGTAKTASDGILERNVHCIAVAGSDVTEATSLSSCDKKCNHTLPLPATELGATVLVTTKTTQDYVTSEELP